jgi:hypothetical protein
MLRVAALLVCLSPLVQAQNAWRELPDPFTPRSAHGVRTTLLTETGLGDGRIYWVQQNRIQSFCLLLAACLCLAALRLRAHRRTENTRERLADSLAAALRGGVLEFQEPTGEAASVFERWQDPEPEEPDLSAASSLFPSRFEVLGYGYTMGYDQALAGGGLRGLLMAPEEPERISDEDLLKGIPLEFLRPSREEPVEPEPEQRLLAEAGELAEDSGEQ